MKKVLASFVVIAAFSAPFNIISTQKNIEEMPATVQYEAKKSPLTLLSDFQAIPERPVAKAGTVTFKDEALTTVAKEITEDKPISIKAWLINANSQPVFKLSDNTYVLAQTPYVLSDTVISQTTYEVEVWLKKGFTLYKEPYYKGEKALSTKLTSYSKVHVTQKAETNWGTYLYIDGQGWVNEDEVSTTDNRLEKVQDLLKQKYNKANLSVTVTQLATGQTTGINQDKTMYSASVSKLPLLYYVQEKLNDKTISLSDKLSYKPEILKFDGAFNPEGSGSMSKTPDNKAYTIEYLLKAVAKESDNVATDILAYYVADQYGKDFQETISPIVTWNMKKREVSSKTAADMMAAIYQQGGIIVDYLSQTNYDNERISKNINVQVAHKIGDAYDFRHDVAIVYAGEPFILSIFTENMTYDQISAIADDIYAILK